MFLRNDVGTTFWIASPVGALLTNMPSIPYMKAVLSRHICCLAWLQ